MNNSPCTHEDRDARTMPNSDGVDVRVWECYDCDDVTPMTAREADWNNREKPLCVRCHHSADFGGPLYRRESIVGPYLVHADCEF